MISLAIEGTTRRIGKSQGYLGLCVRDFTYGDGTPAMETRWEPTPAEVAAINRGEPVTLILLGNAHPPVKVFVKTEGAANG